MKTNGPHPSPSIAVARACKGVEAPGSLKPGEDSGHGGGAAERDLNSGWPQKSAGGAKKGAAAEIGSTMEGVDLSGGPRGKAEYGFELCLTGRTRKPNRFMTLKEGNKWHWWNRRAAFELCRALQMADASALPAGLRSMITPLTLAFGDYPTERRAA